MSDISRSSTNAADIATTIRAWTPASGPSHHDHDAAVAWVRQVVEAARPRVVREAEQALRYAFTYATHVVAAGETLTVDVLTPDRVNHYRDEVLTGARGTRDATTSYLKRLHPDIGLAGTTRKTSERDASSDPACDEPATATEELAPGVDEAIDAFAPTRIAAVRWEETSELCRSAVRRAAPSRPSRARDLCRSAAYLAAWAHANHRAMRSEVVFAGATIEQFVAVLDRGLPARSAATHASNLHALREALGLPLDVERRTFPTSDPKSPYSGAEIDRVFDQARRVPTRARRRHVSAAIHLVLGAGATPADALTVEPDHITSPAPGRVCVDFADRRVEVLADYADGLLTAAEQAREHGDTYLLGGTNSRRRATRFSQLFAARDSGHWAVDFDSTRGRTTFIVEAALDTARYPGVLALLDATGLETLNVVTDLLDVIRGRDAERNVDGDYLIEEGGAP